MIALTQEKREELIAFVNASIEQRCTFYTLAKQRELEALRDQIALASLTAGAVYQERCFYEFRGQFIEYWADVNKSTYGYIHESQRRVLFTVSPVPEIKFPDMTDYEDSGSQYR